MPERRDHVIEDRTYSILVPSAFKGVLLSTRTAVLMGPLVSMFSDLSSVVDPKAPKELKLRKALEKFGQVLTKMDPEATTKLMMDAVYEAHLTVNGKTPISEPLDFDQHFESHKSDVFSVLMWCLWECVCDFFPRAQLETFIQTAKKAAGEAFQSPPTGPSTIG